MPILPSDRNLQSTTEPLVTDVDSGITAIHHTLGPSAFQASPGSHRHDGSDSVRIKFSDIDGGWMNIDGGDANTVFGGLPDFDGGAA
jgi:hypothetical protein